MEKSDTLKIALILAFFGILISGMVITIGNYRKWSSVRTSVTVEYKHVNADQQPDNIALDDNDTDPGNVENNGNSGEIIDYGTDISDNTDDPDGTGTINDTTDPNGNENTPDTDSQTDGTDNKETDNPDSSSSENNPDDGENEAGNSDAGQDSEEGNNDSENSTENTDTENTADNNAGQEKNMEGFYITEITDEIFARINGKSYAADCTVPRESLRYVHVRHYGFEGELRDGELIVNAAIAQDVLEIFEELYEAKYRIEKIRLIDEYGADDEKSMEDNNSSCFNYRTVAESTKLSNHAYGRAIDINPFYNPYVYERSDGSRFLQPNGSEKYLDRTIDADCIIKKGDVCYNAFIRHGFSWGGEWNTKKDYQHFEKVE